MLSIAIDNTSVFVPGGQAPQYGFRRTDFIAANNGVHDQNLFNLLESNVTDTERRKTIRVFDVDEVHTSDDIFVSAEPPNPVAFVLNDVEGQAYEYVIHF